MSAEYRDQVVFVGIDALDHGDALLMPRRTHLLWWALARDVGGRDRSGLHDALGGSTGIPMTAFYDATGKAVDVERGVLTCSLLRADVQELLAGTLRPWRGRQPLRSGTGSPLRRSVPCRMPRDRGIP